MSLTRRSFLAGSSAVAGAALVGCRSGRGPQEQAQTPATTAVSPELPPGSSTTNVATGPSSPVASARASMWPPVADRVLVVVQLSGGNDGLNTVVPLDGRYHDARPTIGLADDTLLAVPGSSSYGLHPSLHALQDLTSTRRLAIVQSVGFAPAGRSHFVALDNWWSAQPGQPSSVGWLGRYLDLVPTDGNPLRAVALGGGVPALHGEHHRPTVVLDPAAFKLASSDRNLQEAWKLMAGQRASAALQALDVFGAITSATRAAVATGNSSDDTEGGDLTDLLATAAELIVGGHGTRVIHLVTSGYDTHADQLATQARLLQDLAVGIERFSTRLADAGLAKRALLMTTSEFGRRVRENGSGGTDHGKASVQFMAGPMVEGGLFGDTDLGKLDDGDLAPMVDPRSLYRSALDWLGAPTEEILGGEYEDLRLVDAG